VAEVFARLQRERQPIAVVLDEYGGTAGMISVDDVVEAIFGDLADEFDTDSPAVQPVAPDRVLVRGDTRVDELNEWLDLFLSDAEADSVGGLVLSQAGEVPQPGADVTVDDVTFRVERMAGNAVTAVSLTVTPEQLAHWRERTT
jgi:putative hemolysin